MGVGPVSISNPDTNNNDNNNNNHKYNFNNEWFLVNNIHHLNFLFKSSTIFRAGQGAGNFVEIEMCPILFVAACLPTTNLQYSVMITKYKTLITSMNDE